MVGSQLSQRLENETIAHAACIDAWHPQTQWSWLDMRRLGTRSLSLLVSAHPYFTPRRSRATALSLQPQKPHRRALLAPTHNKMSTIITAIIECITGGPAIDGPLPDEKRALRQTYRVRPLDEVAEDFVNTILRAEKAGAGLKAELGAIVAPYGWTEYLAEKVLEKLGAALQGTHDKLGPAIRDAYHKAWEVANDIEGLVIQHPVMCTIIALGVLVIVAPWVIEALGFAELGPVEGEYTEHTMPELCAMLTMLK